MNRGREPRWLWAVLALALVVLVTATVFRGRQARLLGGDSRAARTAADGAGLADYGAVPDFTLVSQTGETVRRDDLAGQVWVADFIFTNCASSCPMMSAQLERLVQSLDARTPVRMVSFSVDPERDTPEKLAEYARAYEAEPDAWLFLTGDKSEIHALVQEGFHLSVEDASPEDIAAGAEPVLHSTRFVLVDAAGRIRGYYNGLDDEAMKQLGHDVASLYDEPGS